MKKAVIAVIVIAVMVLGGFSAFAIQGLDEDDSVRILANDGYSTLTTNTVGGTISTTKEILMKEADSSSPGIHVTDTYSVFSLDNAFLKSLLENVSGSSVTFQFAYNADKSAVTFQIKDENNKEVFGTKGRCLGELPYTGSSEGASTLAMVDSARKSVGFSAYYPDANLVRWQLKAGGTYTVTTNPGTFSDTKGHWGSTYIDFLSSRGIASGMGDGTFSPDGSLTRAQFVTFLAKISMEDVSGYSENKFTDVKKGEWYYPYVSWAVAAGITDGVGNNQFAPEMEITREQVTRMTMQFFTYMGIEQKGIRTQADFSDAGKISSWAKDSVGICQAVGVINGFPDGSFHPQANATRAEAATMCSRIVSYGLIMPQ
ncbi:MAG: S-layer homology domain-containing protein [Clostridia bacterium]